MPHILIVDDSATVTHVMGKILSRQGHRVSIARDGEEGCKRAEHDKPDVIMMDLIMPGMDGFQAIRRIKSDPILKDIPIVVHSSKTLPMDKQWALRQGATGYVEKPASERELLASIQPFITAVQ